MMIKSLLTVLVLTLTISNAVPTYTHAAETEGEYDFSWLDPEKKIYVVQNRKYNKAGKFEVSLAGGMGPGKSFRNVWFGMPRASFYFSETFGVSGFFGIVQHEADAVFDNLRTLTSVVPSVRDINNFFGGTVVWVPFYAKINVFNTILYIDWHVEAGAGMINSEIDLNTSRNGAAILEEESFVGFFWGTGQKYFFTRTWAVRLDVFAAYYNAPIAVNGSTAGQDSELEDQYFVTLGISAHL